MRAGLDVDRLVEGRISEALLLVERDLGAGARDDLDAAELLPHLGEAALRVCALLRARAGRLLQELLEVLRSLERVSGLRAALREVHEDGGMLLQGIGLEKREARILVLTLVVGIDAFLEARARLHGDGVFLREGRQRHRRRQESYEDGNGSSARLHFLKRSEAFGGVGREARFRTGCRARYPRSGASVESSVQRGSGVPRPPGWAEAG